MPSHGNPLNLAIIVAAGRGERMGAAGGPKQFRDLCGTSVLARAAQPFLDHLEIAAVQIVIHADDLELYHAAIVPHAKLLAPVIGGATRQQSVLAGLAAVPGNTEKVLIHDAARPFVTKDIISSVLAAVAPGLGALPGQAVADTVKRANGDMLVSETVMRQNLYAAQTPQGFMHGEILAAHRKALASGIAKMTDDAAVAEATGIRVRIVPSEQWNAKLTNENDLENARKRLQAGLPDVRTGNGYDVHRLAPGDHVTLCGVRIDHFMQLAGHSDADVGLHALTDALLGTIGDGDIGSHFPPSDQRWRGASSDRFLKHAVDLVAAQGGVITHLDVTLICEMPKVDPHRQAMRVAIAAIAGIEIRRVAVKATTNEKIGAIGRGEGIAALATATVVF